MSNYSLLLADDEEEVIQAILKTIDFEALGFRVMGYARNGVRALEMAEEETPDVVMTDIRMPYMDGLELAKRLKEEFPATRLLIFTGFDEFSYAKEAVHLEVEEYILKPAGAEELREVFTRLHKSMDEERDEKRNVERLKDYYLQSLPLLQTNFYTSLIEGRIPEEKLPHFLVDYQIDLDAPSYVCVDLHTSSAGLPEEVTTLLVTMSVQRYFEENVSKHWRAKFFSYLGDTVMIAQIDAPSLVRTLTDEMDHLCTAAKKITGALVTAGIGAVVLQLAEIAESYSGDRKAVSLRKLYGGGKSINIMEASDDKKDYVAKALAYTGEHYNDPKLSLDFLCGKLNVSNSYFSTLFKKKTGKSFVAYLTEFRMQQAARMLEETAEKNYRIAESVGYEDANYFSYVFKKQYGCSPSTYRTAHKTA